MKLSEFEVLQLAATLAAPYADDYRGDDSYVERMFHIAEAIKRKLEAQPKSRAEVDVI
ncbi:TPA: hypothetical protein ACFU14_000020 [Neisseria cinerea]